MSKVRNGANLNVDAEVRALMSELNGTTLSNARAFNKGINRDKKLNAFLSADFGKGIKLFTDKDVREKTLSKIEEGIAGYTDVVRKRALIAKVLESSAHEAAQAEVARLIKQLVLTDEQKLQVAKKQAELESFILKSLQPGALALAKDFGMVEEVPAAPVAIENAVEVAN